MTSDKPNQPKPKLFRSRKFWLLGVLPAALAFFLIAFVVWALQSYPPEQDKLASVRSSSSVALQDKGGYWLMTPKSGEKKGLLIFYPGAKVQPDAYLYRLSPLTQIGFSVAVTKPLFNYAFFGINQADQVMQDNSSYPAYWIGGHSLGGAMACEYAKNHAGKLKGLVLVGSYCSSDISQTSLPVLSVAGSRDALATPDKVQSYRKNLPGSARLITVEGMNHAQAANYGRQQGDNEPTVPDDTIQMRLTTELTYFLNSALNP